MYKYTYEHKYNQLIYDDDGGGRGGGFFCCNSFLFACFVLK